MKMKHNKKRNTAFLYESLLKELTKSIVKKDVKKKKNILEMLKRYFSKGTILANELECYKNLLETKTNNKEFTHRLLIETKKDYNLLDKKEIFNTQTRLIKEINESISKQAFANFISNYKSIASVGQYLNSENVGAKSRLILESKIVTMMAKRSVKKEEMKHIDNLTYKTFIDKFNETYDKTLRPEQKELLTNYITSFSDNGLQLKTFMNEEIGRLKETLSKRAKLLNSSDTNRENYSMVIEKLHSFSSKQIDEAMVKKLFYIQDLVYEGNTNGN